MKMVFMKKIFIYGSIYFLLQAVPISLSGLRFSLKGGVLADSHGHTVAMSTKDHESKKEKSTTGQFNRSKKTQSPEQQPVQEQTPVLPDGQKIETEIPGAHPRKIPGHEIPLEGNLAVPGSAPNQRMKYKTAEDDGKIATLEKSFLTAPDDVIAVYLKQLTLDQKIGQRFIGHMKGTEITDEVIHLVQDDYISGIIIYPWNVEDAAQVKKLTSELQRKTLENNPPINLFICVDQEGGRVNAFRLREVTQFPPPYYWAQYDDPNFVEAAAYVISKELFALGCNMNFAPVLDLYGNADKTIIGDRSMGKNPEAIGSFGIFYLEGAKNTGVIPVVKHFPGHGSSIVDSHINLPEVNLEEGVLQEMDFKPFRMVIENGADAIMTAHVLYKKIDPEYPSTLSSKILRGILREQYGFQGVVISDGLSMGALSNNYEIKETLRLMIKAGVDLVLAHSKYDLVFLKNIVHELYEEGKITHAEIDEGVERVLELKLKYGLLAAPLH
jgi:beta-N-acetylhexosaminidase